MCPQNAVVDLPVYTGKVQKKVLDAMADQNFGEPVGEIGRIGVAPVPLNVACGTAEDNGARRFLCQQFGRLLHSRRWHHPVLISGLRLSLEQEGGHQEWQLFRTRQRIDWLELIGDVFPRFCVGAVGVGVEGEVPKVDAAPFGDGPHPIFAAHRARCGRPLVPGAGQSGVGVDRNTQVRCGPCCVPCVAVVVEFDAKGHGGQVAETSALGQKRKAPPMRAGLFG